MFSRKPLLSFAPLLFLTIWFASTSVVNAALPKHYQEKKIFYDALSIVLNKYITPVGNWSLLEGSINGLLVLGDDKLTVRSAPDQIQVTITGKETLSFAKEEVEYNAIALVDSMSIIFDAVFEQFPQLDTTRVIHAAITGMIATLEPNSYFIEPEDLKRLQAQNKGVFGGIGLEITIRNGEKKGDAHEIRLFFERRLWY